MCKTPRFRSYSICAKYHPGLFSPFIHSVISHDSVSGQWRSWSACADAQADLGLRCRHMPIDTFSHHTVQLMFQLNKIYNCCPWKQRTHKERKSKSPFQWDSSHESTVIRRADYHAKLWLSRYYHYQRYPPLHYYHYQGLISQCITILLPSPYHTIF